MLSDLRPILHFDAIQGHISVRMRFTDHEGVACLSLFVRCMQGWWYIRYPRDDSLVEPIESHLASCRHRWFEPIWFFFGHVTFPMPHWGIFPILIEIYRSPLVYMIIHGYEIHARLMIDFILSWYSEEPLLTRLARFILFDIVVIPGWGYLRCLDFPRHHFSGVHIRSVTRPIGAILGLSG